MRQRIVLVAAAWLIGAAATATAATAALNALGSGLLGPANKPLSQADVQRQLAAGGPSGNRPTPTSSTPTPTGSPNASPPATPPTANSGVLATTGGTIVAQCSKNQVTLLSWSPAQGYRTDGVNAGPGDSAWVKFKAGGSELTVTAICTGGQPTAATTTDDHH